MTKFSSLAEILL